MTREMIVNMEVGREIDLLIAEHVMGYVWVHRKGHGRILLPEWWIKFYGEGAEFATYGGWLTADESTPLHKTAYDNVPLYSGGITEAWNVVEKMTGGKGDNEEDHFTLMKFTTHWKAMFDTPDLFYGGGADEVADLPEAETAALAICRAALLATLETQSEKKDED